MNEGEKTPHVFVALGKVMTDVPVIEKQRNAPDPNNRSAPTYPYRRIDDLYDELHGLLSKHGLVCNPITIDRYEDSFTSKSGGNMTRNVIKMEWEFISTIDGSSKKIGPVFGECNDSSDKGINKAYSAAMKVMLVQMFFIPTGDSQADTESNEPEAPGPNAKKPVEIKANSFRRDVEDFVTKQYAMGKLNDSIIGVISSKISTTKGFEDYTDEELAVFFGEIQKSIARS